MKKFGYIIIIFFAILLLFNFATICFSDGPAQKAKSEPARDVALSNEYEKRITAIEEKLKKIIDNDLVDLDKKVQPLLNSIDLVQLRSSILSDYSNYSGRKIDQMTFFVAGMSVIASIILILGVGWLRWYLIRIVRKINEQCATISTAFFYRSAKETNNHAVNLFDQHDHYRAVEYGKKSLEYLDKANYLSILLKEKKNKLKIGDILQLYELPTDKDKKNFETLAKSNLSFYYARLGQNPATAIRWAKEGKEAGEESGDVETLIDTYLYVIMQFKDEASAELIEDCKRTYRRYKEQIQKSNQIPETQKAKFSNFYGID